MMAIDPLEVSRMELRDYGEEVTVLPAQKAAFPATMLFDDGIEDFAIGQAQGHMAQEVFRCLPEDDAQIYAGTLIIMDGIEYLVPNQASVIRRRKCLTVIQVNEQ
jgi:hypothetical protein